VALRVVVDPVVQREGAVGEEVGHHVLVVVQEREDRVELREEDVQCIDDRAGAAQEPRQGIFWPRLLRPAVSAATEFVIWTGMRL
jgi:hypothetical protein